MTHKYDSQVCDGFLQLRCDRAAWVSPRDHSLTLFKLRSENNLRRKSFPHRCVDIWNALSQHVVEAENVLTFERRLDKFLDNQAIKYVYDEKISIPDTGRNNTVNLDDLMQEVSQET